MSTGFGRDVGQRISADVGIETHRAHDFKQLIDAKFAMVAFYAKDGPEHSMVDYYKPQPEPTPPAAKPGTPAAGAKKPGTPAAGAARAATMTPREK